MLPELERFFKKVIENTRNREDMKDISFSYGSAPIAGGNCLIGKGKYASAIIDYDFSFVGGEYTFCILFRNEDKDESRAFNKIATLSGDIREDDFATLVTEIVGKLAV